MKRRLNLLSSDEWLVKQCSEAIESHFADEVELVLSTDVQVSHHFDICFVDLSSAGRRTTLEKLDHLRCLAFIAASDLASLSEELLASRLTVIVKPAPNQRIQQAIAQAIRRCGELESGNTPHEQQSDVILQALLEANLNLQIYDQERTRFLARALHDLRAPLTSLAGYCDLLVDNQLGALSPRQARVLEGMQRTLHRMTQITDGMFRLSLGTDKLQPPVAGALSIEECIRQAVHELTPAFEYKNLEIRLQIFPPHYELKFDSTQFEQVLVNLLDNACKFSPKGSWIEIRAFPCRSRNGQHPAHSFRIEIEDSGPGIQPEMLGHIFEEYLTLASDNGRSGAGLGLAICKLIVRLHGGEILAESTGGGAKFIIELPCGPEADEVDVAGVTGSVIPPAVTKAVMARI